MMIVMLVFRGGDFGITKRGLSGKDSGDTYIYIYIHSKSKYSHMEHERQPFAHHHHISGNHGMSCDDRGLYPKDLPKKNYLEGFGRLGLWKVK